MIETYRKAEIIKLDRFPLGFRPTVQFEDNNEIKILDATLSYGGIKVGDIVSLHGIMRKKVWVYYSIEQILKR